MVVDNFKNRKQYYSLNSGFIKAFTFIEEYNKKPLPDGDYLLDGRNVYAMVKHYKTTNIKDGKWESHREYIDLQYVVCGNEVMGWIPSADLKEAIEYNAVDDCMLYDDAPASEVYIKDGDFVILWPDDAHKPQCSWGEDSEVAKIVIKVKI